MYKVLNIYKPKGWTSFDVVAKVRRALGVKKVGHAGTLDPMAEGVLVVLTGDATKDQEKYMHLAKQYRAKIAFGFETDTYDLEGKIVGRNEGVLSGKQVLKLDELKEKVKSFEGEIVQTVPPFSAVKMGGNRLYNLARKGKVNQKDLPKKVVKVYEIKALDFKNEFIEIVGASCPTLELLITCSSGTYVRSLAFDLGRMLGCGAVLTSLVRTRVGDFCVENSLSLFDSKLFSA